MNKFPIGTVVRVDVSSFKSCTFSWVKRWENARGVVSSEGIVVRTIRTPDGYQQTFHIDYLRRVSGLERMVDLCF